MLLTLRQRFVFFVCISVIGFVAAGLLAGFIMLKFPGSTAAVRIASVCQSMFQFVLPAIVTSLIVTRRPADFLEVSRRPDVITLVLAIAVLIAATPAMNFIIDLNNGLKLPESMRGIENALRAMEDNANATISLLMGGTTVGDLVMSVLIVGVLAGFGEELFFRGTFMRLLTTGRVNSHVAVWSVAIMFSAMHLQVFGFVPRMLLGAYFGYLLSWTRCLWIPIMVHATNNIIYVAFHWSYARRGIESTPIDSVGTGDEWWAVVISAVVTAGILCCIYKIKVKG